VRDDDELQVRAGALPENTKATTDWGICVWDEWASNRVASERDRIVAVTTPLLEMPPAYLAYWMGKFVLEVRKKTGQEYLPKSIYALVCCFKRYYEQHGVFDVNPLSSNNSRFGNFRVTLNATPTKQNLLLMTRRLYSGRASSYVGTHSAVALVNTVYYYNCKAFGLHSYDEHRNLKCTQYNKKVDE